MSKERKKNWNTDNNKEKVISVRVNTELLAALEIKAELEDRNVSSVVRMILNNFFDSKKSKKV